MKTEFIDKDYEALKEENARLRHSMTALLKELDDMRAKLGIKEKATQSKSAIINKYSIEEIQKIAELLRTKITDLPLKVRTKNVLHIYNYTTLYDVIKTGPMDILKLRHFGFQSRNDVRNFLEASDISWDMNPDEILELDAAKQLEK